MSNETTNIDMLLPVMDVHSAAISGEKPVIISGTKSNEPSTKMSETATTIPTKPNTAPTKPTKTLISMRIISKNFSPTLEADCLNFSLSTKFFTLFISALMFSTVTSSPCISRR